MTSAPLDAADFETLADWVDGRLPADQAEAVAEHVVRADARTRAIVDWLRSFVALGRQFPLEDPPSIVRQRLQAHFARWRNADLAMHEEIKRFDATILFDSRTRPALAGTRGAVAEEVLHLAYTTEAADLVLDVQRLIGHQVRINGQVLRSDAGQAGVFEASVSGPGFTIRTVDGDELGRFCLDAVPDDAEELRATNGQITVIARLDVRPDAP